MTGPPCGDDTCGNAEKLSEIYTVFWYNYVRPAISVAINVGMCSLAGVTIVARLYQTYLVVFRGYRPADNYHDFYNDNWELDLDDDE